MADGLETVLDEAETFLKTVRKRLDDENDMDRHDDPDYREVTGDDEIGWLHDALGHIDTLLDFHR